MMNRSIHTSPRAVARRWLPVRSDRVIAAARSGIAKNVPADTTVAGTPQMEIQEWRKVWASIPKLRELIREVRKLRREIEELKKDSS